MKLNINIDARAKEPEIMITTAHMTDDVNRVVDFVSRLDDAPSYFAIFVVIFIVVWIVRYLI